MLYLMTYDDDKRHPVAQRIAEGIAAYTARFGQRPNVIAVNTDEPADERVTKRLATIGRNNYWFGYREEAK